MLFPTCIIISSVDLAHYRLSRAKHWVSVDCGTSLHILDYHGDSQKAEMRR